ncbi:hypothetical protein FRC09_010602, partial [Ceratobasidium sp. 395]
MADHAVWPSSAPATPPAQQGQQKGDNQLRDSVRKIRKRVVSVIRRGSKTGKSRSTSVEPPHHDRGTSTGTDHDEHEDGANDSDHKHADEHVDSGDEHHSQHSARSRTSSTHSIRQSIFGSRSASPQPPATSPQHNGHLTAPSSPSTATRRLSTTFGFPRSPSRKHKSKASEDQSTAEPSARARTLSSPGSGSGALENLIRLSTAGVGVAGAGAGKDENGRLSIPIPKRERAISQPSHPLAASPIQAASPPADQGMTFSFGSAMAQQANAKSSAQVNTTQLVESPETEIPSPPLAASVPTLAPAPVPTPDVIAAPAPDVFTVPTPKTEITPEVVEQRPITPSTGLTREVSSTSTASTQTHDTSVGHTRESSALSNSGHLRESSGGREPNALLSRAASTVGSELGWSIVEEDEPEDEGVKTKVEEVPVSIDEPIKVDVPMAKAEEILARAVEAPVKTEQAPVKVEEVPAKTEEAPVKVEVTPPAVEAAPVKEKTPAKVEEQVQVKFEEVPVTIEPSIKVEDAVQTDDELLQPAHPASGERTPLAASGDDEELMNGAFAFSPEPIEGARTEAPSREPSSGDLAPTGYFIDTPPLETHPTWISSVPTPPRSSTPPRSRVGVSTPMTPPAQTGAAFNPSLSSTPANNQDSPDTPSPSRFSGTYTPYTGDQTPPPPAMNVSESFFHPRNVERLNPRHFERSMSTMGVFGDAEPDGEDVQERLGGVDASMRPSIDTMLAPDVSVHEMISPSVRAAANGGVAETDLRGLAGTELRDWYESEGRTPKTVRMMLPGDEAGPSNTNGASVSRPRSALSQSHTPPLQPPIQLQPSSQEIQQPQSERAQAYSSVLSRLMSHMDRRSALMSRLATRLGNLGGLPVVERHPREWVAQALPSGK